MLNVLELIDVIYEAGADPALWPQAMHRLTEALDGADGVLGGLATGRVPLFIAPRTDPGMVRRYVEHYHPQNPIQLALQSMPVGKGFRDFDLTDTETFHRSEFYNDWCLPQRMVTSVGINIAMPGSGRASLMISGPEPACAEALGGLEQLAPHFTRAFKLNRILGENNAARLMAFSALEDADRGVFLIDAHGKCTPANSLAEQIVTRADGVVLRNGQIECLDAEDSKRLRRAIYDCALGRQSLAGTTIYVARAGGLMPLQILTMPFPASGGLFTGFEHRVMIFVTDQDVRLKRKVEGMRETFKLTRAEATALAELARGGDREQIARRLGLSLATVRTQLTSIFDKTGVRRQADIVRLLMDQP